MRIRLKKYKPLYFFVAAGDVHEFAQWLHQQHRDEVVGVCYAEMLTHNTQRRFKDAVRENGEQFLTAYKRV